MRRGVRGAALTLTLSHWRGRGNPVAGLRPLSRLAGEGQGEGAA